MGLLYGLMFAFGLLLIVGTVFASLFMKTDRETAFTESRMLADHALKAKDESEAAVAQMCATDAFVRATGPDSLVPLWLTLLLIILGILLMTPATVVILSR